MLLLLINLRLSCGELFHIWLNVLTKNVSRCAKKKHAVYKQKRILVYA
jgi:hypothetical protein